MVKFCLIFKIIPNLNFMLELPSNSTKMRVISGAKYRIVDLIRKIIQTVATL